MTQTADTIDVDRSGQNTTMMPILLTQSDWISIIGWLDYTASRQMSGEAATAIRKVAGTIARQMDVRAKTITELALKPVDFGPLATEGQKIVAINQTIRVVQASVQAHLSQLENLVNTYTVKRQMVIKAAWQACGHGVCTFCQTIVPVAALQLIYSKGQYWSGGCYSDHRKEYQELHTACRDCHRQQRRRSGTDKFVAFEAETRDEGIVICHFGHWQPLPTETKIVAIDYEEHQLPGDHPPILPPRIELNWSNTGRPDLVITQQ